MATYTSDKAKAGVATRFLHEGVYVEDARYSSSATLSSGDVIQMVKVPAGSRVVGGNVSTSEDVVISVGDGNDVDRYLASASGGTTTVALPAAHQSTGYEYSANDTVDIVYGGGQTATPAMTIRMLLQLATDN